MSLATDDNLRTAGTTIGGKLHRGAVGTVVAPTNKWPVRPSVPSRVETVLHRDRPSGEDRAFGTSTYRFSDPPADGRCLNTEYQATDSSLRSQKNTLNVSSKGTAAFASAKPAGFTADAPVRALPGPAQYAVPTPTARLTACSFAFSKPVGGRAINAKHGSEALIALGGGGGTPGPGAYSLPEPRQPTSALTSKAARLLVNNPGGPGPGEFLPDSYVNMTAARASRAASSSSHPASYFNKSGNVRFGALNGFGPSIGAGASYNSPGAAAAAPPSTTSPDRRGASPPLVSTAVNLPAPLMRVRPADLSPHVAQALAASLNAPGSQSLRAVPDLPSIADRSRSSKPSAAFRETNLDRFGNPIVRYVTRADDSKIGPGSYLALREPAGKKKLISSSWALDTTKQHAVERESIAPGPAFYSPAKITRNGGTSFHVRENLPKAELTTAKFRAEATMQRERSKFEKATWI